MTTETKTTTSLKKVSPADEVRNTIMSDEVKKQLSMVLPPQMPVERFQRVAITAINKNPDLVDCSRQSLYNAFMQCAQDGLLPDSQEAAIVKYNSKDGAPTAQYQSMVKGILKKMRNSGELKSIMATCIHEHDPFRYWVDDDGEHLTHEPDLFAADRGRIIGAYALAKTKDDAIYIKVMTHAEIEVIRQCSKAKNSNFWTNWWDQMAEKTVIRRLAKRMPMSTDLDDFLRRDDELHDTEAIVTDTQPKPTGKKDQPNRLSKMLGEAGKVVESGADPIAERQKELDAEKSAGSEEPLVSTEVEQTPDADEQDEIKRREIWDSKTFKCTKCPATEFGTDSKEEWDIHLQKVHPQAPQQQKPADKKTNGGGKPAGGGLFGG